MNIAGFAGFRNDVAFHSEARFYEALVHGAHCEQHRNAYAFGAYRAIGQDDQLRGLIFCSGVGPTSELGNCRFKTLCSSRGFESGIEAHDAIFQMFDIEKGI